jgi:hypothetical protein
VVPPVPVEAEVTGHTGYGSNVRAEHCIR